MKIPFKINRDDDLKRQILLSFDLVLLFAAIHPISHAEMATLKQHKSARITHGTAVGRHPLLLRNITVLVFAAAEKFHFPSFPGCYGISLY